MSPDGRLNIFGGFEFVEGFTSNQRALNYDTQTRDDQRRFDMLAGFRVGLILPFYNIGKGGSDEEIFY